MVPGITYTIEQPLAGVEKRHGKVYDVGAVVVDEYEVLDQLTSLPRLTLPFLSRESLHLYLDWVTNSTRQ